MPADPAVDRRTRALLTVLVVVCVARARDRGRAVRARPRPVGALGAHTPTITSAPPEDRRRRRVALVRRARTRPLRLWVGGDSLAAGPSWAVFEAARATSVIQPLAEYQVGAGLVPRRVLGLAPPPRRGGAGADRRSWCSWSGRTMTRALAVDGTSYRRRRRSGWPSYRRRVGGIMDVLTGGGRQVVWIGMPPMQGASYSEAMGLIGGLMAEEAATRPAVTYVDAFAMFSATGAPGVYTTVDPRRGRRADGGATGRRDPPERRRQPVPRAAGDGGGRSARGPVADAAVTPGHTAQVALGRRGARPGRHDTVNSPCPAIGSGFGSSHQWISARVTEPSAVAFTPTTTGTPHEPSAHSQTYWTASAE